MCINLFLVVTISTFIKDMCISTLLKLGPYRLKHILTIVHCAIFPTAC